MIPPVYLLLHLIGMTALHFGWPGFRWLSTPWTYAGAVLIAAGIALAALGARQFARYGTSPHPFLESTALVVDGPFRFTRNPMYLGMIVVLLGVATLSGAATPVLAIPTFVWIITTRFIVKEERLMTDRFGRTYLDYKDRVRRWI